MEEKEERKQTAEEPVERLGEMDEVIERILESLRGDDAKPSVADLTRLLELRRDLAQSLQGPITVRWIDEWQQIPDYEV
jgi:hypothetical protein